jgi:MtN3 and saliva related transmembrane protein
VQLIGGVILSFGWLPQIIQMIKTRSAKGLNVNTVWSMLLGITYMELYAIDLVLIMMVFILSLRYRKE